jgi:hypothetical protein
MINYYPLTTQQAVYPGTPKTPPFLGQLTDFISYLIFINRL